MKKLEIGSDFWDVPLSNEVIRFPPQAAWFVSGRAALSFIIEDIQAGQPLHSAALPSWCCHTMIEPFLTHGVKVLFYPVYPAPNGGLVKDLSQLPPCDALLWLDYFGYTAQDSCPDFDGIMIQDVTHSVFSSPPSKDADYIFGSLRKWAGFLTAGYAWKQNSKFQIIPPTETDMHYVALRRKAMEEKQAYLQGKRANKEYLTIFAEAETLLDGLCSGAAMQDIEAANHFDISAVRTKRRENAAVLLEAVSNMALFPNLEKGDCPLFVPVRIPAGKRDALRKYLISHEIYCPVHWPRSPLHQIGKLERKIYEEELSLVCDQRYGTGDMERIVNTIRDFLKRET